MIVTDKQVRILMKLIKTEKTKYLAACKSRMDEKTARKYIRSKKLSSQLKNEHTWRTRKDPFEDVWSDVRSYLEVQPYFFIFKEDIQADFLMVNFGHYKER